ncbi:UbiA family prenyltransferase [Streptomyces sp. SID10853]|uniref:UbiA family prenyltransferase n=1 Tax=Streptomyces sp. SID10853 TaxID=2706028 RepID=UPI0013BED014|nr:UbiA family prenyltransferase [Streptomyces sp. SID10853]NDZ81081.1 UbiA family prenyltransferase [Streptomyces sp. SID10853]
MTSRTEAAGPFTADDVRPESKARSYARLGKLDVYDYYPGIAVALSAVLLPVSRLRSATVGTLALFLAGAVFVIVAMVALDDVTGYRDGSDAANYGPDNPLRNKLRKPLVAGTLTLREALTFGWATAVIGAVLWAAAVAAAPSRPTWTVVLIVITFVVAVQYSYGLKISYHGFQEMFIAGLGVALVMAPYGLAAGHYSGFLLVQGVLFGFGPLMFGVYSNTNDIPGDRAVGRPTVACLVSAKGNAVFIGALSAAEFLLGAVASATGVAPWWFVLLMLPATVLRTRQYLTGFRRGDIMRARKLGFSVHRVSTVLLIAANLLAGAGAVG